MADYYSLSFLRDGANFLAAPLRKVLEAIRAKLTFLETGPIFGSRINWNDSPVLPREIIPPVDLSSETTIAFLSCLDIYRDGVAQYRDDDSLFFGPGHILHRGIFKTQTCNDDGSWASALASSLIIPDECPSGGPTTTSGLDAEEWYYIYWKLDVAGEGPEYRISKVMPVRCDGRGPEHPLYDKLRFVGSFRTGLAPGAAIRPYHRYHNGRVFWREIEVGPLDPTNNVNPNAAGFTTIDLSADAPPTAQAVFLTAWLDSENEMFIRTEGDITVPAGYHIEDESSGGNVPRVQQTWIEIPTNVMDGTTGAPGAAASISLNSDSSASKLAVAGYFEAML